MSTITRTIACKIGSLSASGTKTQEVNAIPPLSASLPTAKAGTLTTRTDTTSGEITADSSDHGIGTGDIVDLYWTGGARQGVTVGTVDGTAIPISGGAGDDLPAASTSIRVAPTVTFDFPFEGDDAKAILVKSNRESMVDFRTAAASAWTVVVDATNHRLWWIDDEANPIAGDDIATIRCSNGSVTNTAALQIVLGLDVIS